MNSDEYNELVCSLRKPPRGGSAKVLMLQRHYRALKEHATKRWGVRGGWVPFKLDMLYGIPIEVFDTEPEMRQRAEKLAIEGVTVTICEG